MALAKNRRIEHDTEHPILIDHLLQVAGDYEVAVKIVVPETLTFLTQLDIGICHWMLLRGLSGKNSSSVPRLTRHYSKPAGS